MYVHTYLKKNINYHTLINNFNCIKFINILINI